eukprot:1138198-Pelagomonas_calceolata.AAC.12
MPAGEEVEDEGGVKVQHSWPCVSAPTPRKQEEAVKGNKEREGKNYVGSDNKGSGDGTYQLLCKSVCREGCFVTTGTVLYSSCHHTRQAAMCAPRPSLLLHFGIGRHTPMWELKEDGLQATQSASPGKQTLCSSRSPALAPPAVQSVSPGNESPLLLPAGLSQIWKTKYALAGVGAERHRVTSDPAHHPGCRPFAPPGRYLTELPVPRLLAVKAEGARVSLRETSLKVTFQPHGLSWNVTLQTRVGM